MNWKLCRIWLTKGEQGVTLEERRYKLGPTACDQQFMERDVEEWIGLGPHRNDEDIYWHWITIKENIKAPEPYMYIRLAGEAHEVPQRDCWDREWPKPW